MIRNHLRSSPNIPDSDPFPFDRPLNDLHQVPDAVQLLRRRQASRAAADDAHAAPRAAAGRLRLDPALGGFCGWVVFFGEEWGMGR